MEFSIKRDKLLQTIERAAMALAEKHLKPILTNFYCELRKGSLTIIATDLGLSVVAMTGVKTKEEGRFLLPGRVMMDLVRFAPDKDIVFKIENSEVSVTCGNANWTLKLMEVENYPQLPQFGKLKCVDINRKSMLRSLERCRLVAPLEEYRQTLSVINISNSVVQATDGARLHQSSFETDVVDAKITTKAVNDLIRFLSLYDVETIRISQTNNHVVFKIGDDWFVATKADNKFPDLSKAIDIELGKIKGKKGVFKVEVDKQSFLDSINRVRLTADEETNMITLDFDENIIVVSSKDKFGNYATEKIDTRSGSKRTVNVNYKYLSDLIQATTSSKVKIMLAADAGIKRAPIIVKEEDFVGIVHQLKVLGGKK